METDVRDKQKAADQVMPMQLTEIDDSTNHALLAESSLMQTPNLTLEHMSDVPVTLVFEVGRAVISIKQLMELNTGSFVELRQVSVDTIDVYINDKIIAYAETIALQQRYGIRFGDLIPLTGAEDLEANE